MVLLYSSLKYSMNEELFWSIFIDYETTKNTIYMTKQIPISRTGKQRNQQQHAYNEKKNSSPHHA